MFIAALSPSTLYLMQKQRSDRPGELEVLFEEEKISQYGGEIRVRHQKLRLLQNEVMSMRQMHTLYSSH